MTTQIPAEIERAMREAVNRHASDLFMIPGEPLTFRIGGAIARTEGEVFSAEQIRAICTAMAGPERLNRMFSERGVIVIGCDCGDLRGRMSICMSRGEYSITVGMLPEKILTPEQLAIPASVLHAVDSRDGLVIFAGPVGSGKTTSAFAVLDHLNATKPIHISTVEDPISYIIRPKRAIVQQREVGVDVPDTASGMIAALAQDPDLLFVAELRNPQEVVACVTAALMGHLVITQVHASSPEHALRRLIASQPAEQQASFRSELSRVLRCVCAQLLLPRADGKGKIAAYAMLLPDASMRQQIAEGRYAVVESVPHGCVEMEQEIGRLARDNLVTPAAAETALARLREQA